MKSHVEQVHGSKKPDDSEIKRLEMEKEIKKLMEIPKPVNAIDKWIKSHIEKVHKSKKPDTDSSGENFKSHIAKVHESKKPDGSEINSSYTLSWGGNLKPHVEKVHVRKKPDDSEIKNLVLITLEII